MKYAIWLSCFFNLLSACRTTKASISQLTSDEKVVIEQNVTAKILFSYSIDQNLDAHYAKQFPDWRLCIGQAKLADQSPSIIWFEPKRESCKKAHQNERNGIVVTQGHSNDNFSILAGDPSQPIGFGVDSGISGGELSERFTVLTLCFKEARKLANDDSVKCDLVVNNEGKLTLKFK